MTAACHRSSVRTPDPGLPSESGEWDAILDMAMRELPPVRHPPDRTESPVPGHVLAGAAFRRLGRPMLAVPAWAACRSRAR